MCEICGNDTDHEEPWTPQMYRALELIRELYATRDGIIGGPLHAVLDDMNLYDDQRHFWENVDYRQSPGYEWENEAGLRRIVDELSPLLSIMTEEERITAVTMFHAERSRAAR